MNVHFKTTKSDFRSKLHKDKKRNRGNVFKRMLFLRGSSLKGDFIVEDDLQN